MSDTDLSAMDESNKRANDRYKWVVLSNTTLGLS